MIHIDKHSIDYMKILLKPNDVLIINDRRAIILEIHYNTPNMVVHSVDVMFLDNESKANYFIKDLVSLGAIDG